MVMQIRHLARMFTQEEVMGVFASLCGTVNSVIEKLVEVELERAPMAELEQNYFVKARSEGTAISPGRGSCKNRGRLICPLLYNRDGKVSIDHELVPLLLCIGFFDQKH